MPNDQEMKDALREEFKRQVNLWNTANYEKLAERFDENIIMKKLDDPGSVIGIGNVLAYLRYAERTSSSRALASTKLGVSNPSVKDLWTGTKMSRASRRRPDWTRIL
jgi:hypothetical protein